MELRGKEIIEFPSNLKTNQTKNNIQEEIHQQFLRNRLFREVSIWMKYN